MSGKPRKRSLTIAGHRTSVSLEDDFWDALQDMAKVQGRSVPALIADIDSAREDNGLSSAIRSAILRFYRSTSANN